MNTFKIKIVKCRISPISNWYLNKVGEEFNVINCKVNHLYYIRIDDKNNECGSILKTDCEIIKPIGYKCPIDISEWSSKKGDIWIKHNRHDCYWNSTTQRNINLPKEWVETWEPIYKTKTERELDHENIDNIINHWRSNQNKDFNIYLKENNYTIVKKKYNKKDEWD